MKRNRKDVIYLLRDVVGPGLKKERESRQDPYLNGLYDGWDDALRFAIELLESK